MRTYDKNISVSEGYLTAHDKKALKAILSTGKQSGRVGRKDYFIKQVNDSFQATIAEKDNSLVLTKDKIRYTKVRFNFR